MSYKLLEVDHSTGDMRIKIGDKTFWVETQEEADELYDQYVAILEARREEDSFEKEGE